LDDSKRQNGSASFRDPRCDRQLPAARSALSAQVGAAAVSRLRGRCWWWWPCFVLAVASCTSGARLLGGDDSAGDVDTVTDGGWDFLVRDGDPDSAPDDAWPEVDATPREDGSEDGEEGSSCEPIPECIEDCSATSCTQDCLDEGCIQRCSAERCRQFCREGACAQTCDAADTCTQSCAGGRCDQDCRAAVCSASCEFNSGCSQTCTGAADCLLRCNDVCSQDCDGTGYCSLSCGARCTQSCRGTRCDVNCAQGCTVACDAASCSIDLGLAVNDETSSVACGPESDCDIDCYYEAGCAVRCQGSCLVRCPNGRCDVRCADGLAAPSCPATEGHTYACNRVCPG